MKRDKGPVSASNFRSEKFQSNPRGSIAESWAREDLDGAADWALTLEDAKTQEDAIDRVSKEWLEHHTEEASIWISELEKGPSRDEAVGNLVDKVIGSDTEAAFAWAATIEGQKARQNSAWRAVKSIHSHPIGMASLVEKVVGCGWFPTKETECEQTKTNQAQFCRLSSALQAHPCGDGSQSGIRVWGRSEVSNFSACSHMVTLLYAQLTHSIGLNDVCDALRHHSS